MEEQRCEKQEKGGESLLVWRGLVKISGSAAEGAASYDFGFRVKIVNEREIRESQRWDKSRIGD